MITGKIIRKGLLQKTSEVWIFDLRAEGRFLFLYTLSKPEEIV